MPEKNFLVFRDETVVRLSADRTQVVDPQAVPKVVPVAGFV